jgi:hypothetical protein
MKAIALVAKYPAWKERFWSIFWHPALRDTPETRRATLRLQRIQLKQKKYVDLQQFCLHYLPLLSTLTAISLGNAMENSGKQTPKSGFKSPPSRGENFVKTFV